MNMNLTIFKLQSVMWVPGDLSRSLLPHCSSIAAWSLLGCLALM